MTDSTCQALPLTYGVAETSDVDLASELYEATAILAMGTDDGIAAHVAADLRRRRLDAARELLCRWSA